MFEGWPPCLRDRLPVALNTTFGWILMGGLQMPVTMEPQDPLAFYVMCETPVDEVLRGFWELEEVPGTIQPTQTHGAEVCEKHFRDTYSRDDDGRYVVRLPFNNKGLKLGSSYHIAQHRFLALERRLDRDEGMRALYMDFMKEYLEAGHMELVDNLDVESTRHYYTPHHGVLKLSSSTTKLRVVFDASCKTASDSKCSLNDMLLGGPKLQKNIVEILLRFPSHPFVFTADIKQIFRGVWLHKEDRNFQLILWRSSRNEELKTYRLKTVTFGVRSSPYLAMRSLLQLAEDEGDQFPAASIVIQRDVFVSGAASVDEAKKMQTELIHLLGKGGFQLRKWATNSKELISAIPEAEREIPKSFSAVEDQLYEILGIRWLSVTDSLVYSNESHSAPVTKRSVLSAIARFYDPLGYLAPVVFWAKYLMQHLWTLGHAVARGFANEVGDLTEIYAWTDSSVVLSWIRTSPHLLKTFVANRVADIQSHTTPEIWRHVPSQLNPADCSSRGLYPRQLVEHALWFEGPPFLSLLPALWPKRQLPPLVTELPEMKSSPLQVLVTTHQEVSLTFLEKFSSWLKLVRVTAYVLRFIHNVRHPDFKRDGCLSTSENRRATVLILKATQLECFGKEYSSIKKGELCSVRIQRLSPFLDPAGLLRVGSRLNNSGINYGAKHPILLPKNHIVTDLIITFFHKSYLHAGPRILQSLIVRQYWILSCRVVVRKIVRQCVTCFRNVPVNRPPVMADLPAVRVTPARAFNSVHLDYAGPFIGKTHKRSKSRCKIYLCLFICSSTKALHLEAVSEMSTPAFIAALQRFFARRGMSAHIYSDCGTNFIGASRELKRLFQFVNSPSHKNQISDFASSKGIVWHFQPPAAPHFGGLHESAIKLAKFHLKRVIGQQILTFEEYVTVFAQIEAVLNSRLLCPLSDDPSESEDSWTLSDRCTPYGTRRNSYCFHISTDQMKDDSKYELPFLEKMEE